MKMPKKLMNKRNDLADGFSIRHDFVNYHQGREGYKEGFDKCFAILMKDGGEKAKELIELGDEK